MQVVQVEQDCIVYVSNIACGVQIFFVFVLMTMQFGCHAQGQTDRNAVSL